MSYNQNNPSYNPELGGGGNQPQQHYGGGQPHQQYGQPQQHYSQPQQNYGQPLFQQPPQQYIDPLLQYFQAVDIDKSGSISPKEFLLSLKKTPSKLSLSIECGNMLTKMFQIQKKKFLVLNFNEFKNAYNYLVQVQKFFHQVDTDKSGSLDSKEMLRACQMSGYIIDYPTFHLLFLCFDKTKSGELNMNEYIEICIFLATLLKSFAEKTPGKSMKITQNSKANFTFSQLTSLATTIKYGM